MATAIVPQRKKTPIIKKTPPAIWRGVQRASCVSTSVRAQISHVANQIKDPQLQELAYAAMYLSQELEKLLENTVLLVELLEVPQ